MPIYAYRCDDCGFAKDVLQKLSDPVLTVCPNCGKPAFKKQLTAAGFQLKGTGWYATDFRGGTPPSTAVSTGPKETGSADSKSESKAEPKSDNKSTPAAPGGGSD